MSGSGADMTPAPNITATLNWIEEREGERYDTLAHLSIALDGQPIWPVWGDPFTDLDVFTDDLLSFLVENWKKLLLEQDYPRSLKPALPSQLLTLAQSVASDEPQATAEALLLAVERFENSHDLSTAIGGQFDLPPFWMVRRGDGMLVETGGRARDLTLDAWLSFASGLGQTVADRLRERAEEKFSRLLSAWDRRDEGDPLRLLSLAIGQSYETSEGLVQDGLLHLEASVVEVANDNDVMRAAARMVGAAPYQQIKSVLLAIADTPAGPSEALDRFATSVRASLEELPRGSAPHVEGAHAAQRLRELLEVSSERPANPLAALDLMQVPVFPKSLQLATLDALAVWGEQHGPAVVVNVDSRRFGRHLSGPAGRATIAHEVCHLLLDRGRSLAAIDILNGRMPATVEKRAGAFAAEFLLPARVAAVEWRKSPLPVSREGIATVLRRLADRFNVSRQLAAWQLDHGLLGAEPEVLFWLDEIIPQRRERGGRQ